MKMNKDEIKRSVKNSKNKIYNKVNSKGISLLILVITIIVVVIIAGVVILNFTNRNSIKDAKEASFRNDIQTMKELRVQTYNSKILEYEGDKKKIEDSDFSGIVDAKYSDRFHATSDGIVFDGSDPRELEIAIEMGCIIETKLEEPKLTSFSAFADSVKVTMALEVLESKSGMKPYQYLMKEEGKEFQIIGTSDKKTFETKDVKQKTKYIVKAMIEDKAGHKIETEEKEVMLQARSDVPVIEYATEGWHQKQQVSIFYDNQLGNKNFYQIDGGKEVTVPGNETSFEITKNNTEITATTVQKSGRKKVSTVKISNIDTEKPNQFMPKVTVTSNSLLVEGSTTDNGASGIAGYRYSKDNGMSYTEVKTQTSHTFDNLTQDTNYLVRMQAVDKAGNVIETSSVSIKTVKIGTPEIKVSTTSWTNQNVKVTITYPSIVGGINEYSTDGKTYKTYAGEMSISSNQTIYARTRDSKNQTGGVAQKVISNIDKSLPTTTISPNGGNYVIPTGGTVATIKARITATDSGGSGLNLVQYAWSTSNTAEPTAWTDFTAGGQDISTTSGVGTKYLWTKVTDKAGNRATTIKVSGAYVVTNDSVTNAKITLTPSMTGWTNQNINVTISYGSSISQNRKAGMQGGTLIANATSVTVAQNGVVYAEATDIAGNKVTKTLQITTIDKTLPTASISPNGGKYTIPTGGSTATIKAKITAVDGGGSGLNLVQYAWSTSNTTEPTAWTNFTATGQELSTTSGVGTKYLWTKVTDKAGNRATIVKVSGAYTVTSNTATENKITLTPNTTGWTNQNVVVTVVYGSSISQYRKAGMQGGTLTANATSVTVSANGVVYAEATDVAGNKVTKTLQITTIDKSFPTTAISPNGGKYTIPTGGSVATIKAKISASDTGGSGLNLVQYAWSTSNTAEPTTWNNFTATGQELSTTSGVGTKYLWTKVTDKAGNRATTIKVSDAYTVATNTSVENNITLTPNTTNWTNQNITVTVGYGSSISQNRKAGMQGGTLTANATSVTVAQNGVVYAEATDIAGNKVTKTLQITNIDKTFPTTSLSPSTGNYVIPTGGSTATIKARITATDGGGSGLNLVQYAWSTSNTTEPTAWINFTATGQELSTTSGVGTKYLWTKVIDKAGNRATTIKVSGAYTVSNDSDVKGKITLTPSTTEWTNQNVVVTVGYGSSLTQNKKAGMQGGSLTANATSVTVSANGVVYAEATDIAGNKVTKTLQITTIDKALPTTAISPNGGKYTIPTGGSSATIKTRITASDTGGSGLNLVQYAWSTSNTTEPTSWTNFSAAGQDISATNGTGTKYLWTKVMDKAGNRATSVKVSNAYTVTANTATENQITLTPSTTGWTKQNVIVTVGYGSNLIQNKKAGIQGGTLVANATSITVSTNGVVYAEATDIAGNKITKTLSIGNIDTSKPSTPTINNPSHGSWTKNNFSLTLNASDVGSGIAYYEYSYDQSNWTKYVDSAKNSFVTPAFTAESNRNIYIRATDKVGNVSGVASTAIRIDKTGPITPTITNPTNGNWTNTDFSLTVTSSDAGAGIAYYEYSYDQINWVKYTDSAKNSFVTTPFSVQRNQNVYIRVTDALGNVSQTSATPIRIDKEKPTVGMTQNGGRYTIPTGGSTATIKTRITASDSGGSGLNVVQYAWSTSNTTEPTAWTNYTAGGQDITKSDAGAASYYIWFKVMDVAGNRSTYVVSNPFVVLSNNATENKIILSPSTTNWTNGNVTVTVSYGSNLTQNRKAGIGSANQANATQLVVTTNNGVYAEATDIAGNKVTASLWIGNIDKTPPSGVTVTYNGGSNTCNWKNNYNLSLSATDNLGIAHYEIDWDGNGIADTTTGANFIPWNGYSSCNTRFRAIDSVGNPGAWSGEHHIHMDTEIPQHTNWWWGEVNKNVARLYIQATDNVGIQRVQVPTSTASGSYNNWITFDAVWDAGANAYRVDITPASFGHYNQWYTSHLYIYDHAGNGGYYNQTGVQIPPNSLNLDFNSQSELDTYFTKTYWSKDSTTSSTAQLSVDNGTAYFYEPDLDNFVRILLNNTTPIKGGRFSLGLWKNSYSYRFVINNFRFNLNDGNYILFYFNHGINASADSWKSFLPSPHFRSNFVVYNSINNSYLGIGGMISDGYHTYSFSVDGSNNLTFSTDAGHSYTTNIGNRYIERIDFNPLEMWWGHGTTARLDYLYLDY